MMKKTIAVAAMAAFAGAMSLAWADEPPPRTGTDKNSDGTIRPNDPVWNGSNQTSTGTVGGYESSGVPTCALAVAVSGTLSSNDTGNTVGATNTVNVSEDDLYRLHLDPRSGPRPFGRLGCRQ